VQDYRININYAKALFQLADDTQEQERVSQDMRLVHQVCVENRELNAIFDNPEINAGKKAGILTALFGEHVSKTTLTFLVFVAKKKRSVNLKGICSMYLSLYRDSRGIVLSQLTTAQPADEETKAMVRKTIGDYTHKQVELETKTDPSVIGGFAMEFYNNMYDATIATQLLKLRREFAENVYESKL
jgi:F-type H+-transporting ATPase subunit delta